MEREVVSLKLKIQGKYCRIILNCRLGHLNQLKIPKQFTKTKAWLNSLEKNAAALSQIAPKLQKISAAFHTPEIKNS